MITAHNAVSSLCVKNDSLKQLFSSNPVGSHHIVSKEMSVQMLFLLLLIDFILFFTMQLYLKDKFPCPHLRYKTLIFISFIYLKT